MSRRTLLVLGVFLGIICASNGSSAEEAAVRSSAAHGENNSGDTQAVSDTFKIDDKKLTRILEADEALLQDQQALNQRLDAAIEELHTIKVRSSVRPTTSNVNQNQVNPQPHQP